VPPDQDGEEYALCRWGDNPRTVLLAGRRDVDLVDLRAAAPAVSRLLSLRCPSWRTSHNVTESETLTCLAASTRRSVRPPFGLSLQRNILVVVSVSSCLILIG